MAPQKVVVTVTDHPTLSEPLREVLAGHYIALVEMTGAHNVQVERDDAPPVWRWIITWE